MVVTSLLILITFALCWPIAHYWAKYIYHRQSSDLEKFYASIALTVCVFIAGIIAMVYGV